MPSDGDALLKVICERPREDTPRLMYADWLDEHGDPLRAEFIRETLHHSRALPVTLIGVPPERTP